MIVENWEKYKDNKYYDHLCGCKCGGRIEVKSHHKYTGIPQYIEYHHRIGKILVPREVRFCECKCGGSKEVLVTSTWRYFRGHNTGEKQIQAMREVTIGRKRPAAEIEKIRVAVIKLWQDPIWRKNQVERITAGIRNSEKVKELHKSPKYRENLRKKAKERWADPEYKEKQLKAIFAGLDLRPNKPETLLLSILQELFPEQWRYVGDGTCWIAGKNPDFIGRLDQKKKIIELFGDYWHGEALSGLTNEQAEKERIDHFKSYGYQTLIVWEHEVTDIVGLTENLLRFVRN